MDLRTVQVQRQTLCKPTHRTPLLVTSVQSRRGGGDRGLTAGSRPLPVPKQALRPQQLAPGGQEEPGRLYPPWPLRSSLRQPGSLELIFPTGGMVGGRRRDLASTSIHNIIPTDLQVTPALQVPELRGWESQAGLMVARTLAFLCPCRCDREKNKKPPKLGQHTIYNNNNNKNLDKAGLSWIYVGRLGWGVIL